MSVFREMAMFMRACDQTTREANPEQKKLYLNLIDEEVQELKNAATPEDELDALIDIMVVTIGALHSAGYHGEGAWREVMRTNFAKIDRATKKVIKREDGKILKPEGWKPPQLTKFIRNA